MELDGEIFDAIHEAFNVSELERLVRFRLNVNLQDISLRPSKNDLIFDLIEWCNRQGRIRELLRAAAAERPNNPKFPVLLSRFKDPWPAPSDASSTPSRSASRRQTTRPLNPPTRPASDQSSQRPIRILFLASNPLDTVRLKLGQEVRAIDQALRASDFRDLFDFEQQWAVRVSDLEGLLLRYNPDVVHFSGHGSLFSEIILEGENGRSQPVEGKALGRLFSVLKGNIRCVVLSACYSAGQAGEIARTVDCVVGMSNVVGDEAAIRFAAAFYQALGYGKDIQTAFDLGCLEIDLERLADDDKPRLLSHLKPKEIYLVSPR
jgi:hypothetical protein